MRGPFIPGKQPRVENGVCTAALHLERRAVVVYCDRGEVAQHALDHHHGGDVAGAGNIGWVDGAVEPAGLVHGASS